MLFFKQPTGNLTLDSSQSRNIIMLLTEIRNNTYNFAKMNKVTVENLNLIKELSIDIAQKMLLSDLESTGRVFSLSQEVNKLIHVMDKLCTDKFSMIVYACQLLQYFTIRCNEQCGIANNLEDFQTALRLPELGDSRSNLFVKEHELILLYNDLINIERSLDASTKEVKLDQVISKMPEIKLIIKQAKKDCPNNTYPLYLNFIINYTCAKAIEIKFKIIKDTLDADEQEFTSASQQAYLKLANSDLKDIKRLEQYSINGGAIQINGLEYTLGQEPFKKMTSLPTLDAMKAHIDLLIGPDKEPSTTVGL